MNKKRLHIETEYRQQIAQQRAPEPPPEPPPAPSPHRTPEDLIYLCAAAGLEIVGNPTIGYTLFVGRTDHELPDPTRRGWWTRREVEDYTNQEMTR